MNDKVKKALEDFIYHLMYEQSEVKNDTNKSNTNK